MITLDKSILEYLQDLSQPSVNSSSDLEDIQLKREIIRINFLTTIISIIIVFAIINIFLFYLPGLYNVSFLLFEELLTAFVVNWILLVGIGIVIGFFTFIILRNT